jgi:acyl-homoserine-lactone acylase
MAKFSFSSLRSFRRVTVSTGVVLALVAGTVACSGDSDTTEDLTSTSVAQDGDFKYQATIRRTPDGVPHILADDLPGVFYGQGYASGQDHACSLADQMLKVQSRRAANLGRGAEDANVISDFAWAAIGIDAIGRKDYAAVPAHITDQFEAFAAGWNAHLEAVGTEGLTGWCQGEAWVTPITGEDLYAYARSIALNASGSRLTNFIATAEPPFVPSTDPPSQGANYVTSVASNGWAVGRDRVEGGQGGVLLANPHFPWEGELRFWEVQLTVPGEIDIYGANLLGVPGIGIGFTEEFAWTHTVSAGSRFTAYTLTLAEGDPLAYLVDGATVPMESREFSIDVLLEDGTTASESRTMWFSEYGPILNFPGVGWSETLVTTYRDANIDNDEFILQYAAMMESKNLDEFIDAHREFQGVPLFNTIAVSRDGRVWYGDISATPNLSDEAESAYKAELAAGGIATVARQSGAVLLDGSKSINRWEEQPGSRDPGLVPWEELPMTERTDVVFNANDSFWVNNTTETLDGQYSILHGEQDTARSLRTRENLRILDAEAGQEFSGDGGLFTAEEIRNAALANSSFPAWMLRAAVVERCAGATSVSLDPLLNSGGTEVLPAATIDVTEACQVLGAWDGTFNLDAPGAPLWREWMGQFSGASQRQAGDLFVNDFDATDPLGTPNGLTPATGEKDLVLINLARAVQILQTAGFDAGATLGETQFAARSSTRIPIHGGIGSDGVPNVVNWGSAGSSTELIPTRGDRIAPGSTLTKDGYPINYGTSFIMAVDYTNGAPEAWALLTYSNTGDRTSAIFDSQMSLFSAKQWRQVLYTESDIDAEAEVLIVQGN